MHAIANVGESAITNPNWTQDFYFTQRVEGDDPNPGPSWTTKFATLYNSSLGIGYSGGGETIPAHKERRDYVPVAREQGKETWTADEDPFVAARTRLWEDPGDLTFELIDIGGGGGS